MDKVKLYIASTVGELNKKGNYDFEPSRSIKIHIKHSDSTFKAAEEARLKKDEERAYVLYMRYLDIFQKVRKSRDYKKDEDHYGLLLGTTKFQEAISHAETLSKSLKKRYEEKKATNLPSTNQKTPTEQNNNVAPSKKANPPKKADLTPKTEKPILPEDAKSMNCATLQKLRFSKSVKDVKVLIIDVRDSADFKTSRIRHDDSINVPSDILTPGTICRKIESSINDQEQLTMWKKRAEYDILVLLDWFSEEKDLSDQKNPLRNLFDALHKWEQDIFLRRAPVVLSGGYADWIEFYPQLTTNPKADKPKKVKTGVVSIESLSDINFNDLLQPQKLHNGQEKQNLPVNGYSESNEDVGSTPFDLEQHPSIQNGLANEPKKSNLSDLSTWKISSASSAIFNSLYSDQEPAINGQETADDSSVTSTNIKKNIPTVNRSTKPGVRRDLKPNSRPSAHDQLSEPKALSTSEAISPKNDSQSEPSPTSISIKQMQDRLEEQRKKKESDAAKLRELEEKMKLIELQEEEQRLKREAEEEERRRKEAEKELAIRMRELRKSSNKGNNGSLPTIQTTSAKPNDETTSKPAFMEEPQKSLTPETFVKPTVTLPNIDGNSGINNKDILPKPTDSSKSQVPTTNDDPVKPIKKVDVMDSKPEKPSDSAPSLISSQLEPVTKLPSVVERPTEPKPAENDPKVIKSKPATTNLQSKPKSTQPPRPLPSRDTKPVSPTTNSKPIIPEQDPTASKPQSVPAPTPSSAVKPSSSNSSRPPSKPAASKPNVTPSTQRQPRPLPQKPEVSNKSGSLGEKDSTLSTSLPMNWEKRLDGKTGRYFYLDHNTHTTHWNLPGHVNVKKRPQTARLKDDSTSTSSGLKRSSSTPNIADLVANEPVKPLKPSINRSSKPSLQQRDLSDSPDDYVQKLSRLHPNSGGRGPGQCGLHNLGNTCYMNSVLQCMFNTSLLAEYFLTNKYKLDINRENFLGSGGQITDGFAVLMKAVWDGHYKSVTPRDFRNLIGTINTRFSSYSQQDSQELLLFLMDGLHEDLNVITKREYKEEKENEGMSDADAAKMAWDFHKRLNKSIIVELFQGQFKAATQCLSCRKTSRKFDVFMYLSVPLPSRGSCNISDCLDKFSEVEKLSGDNKWFCPNCKKDQDAVRKMEIWKLPPVLLIHFKRFSFSGRWGDKLQTNVKFPSTNLDLNKYIIGPKSKRQYNLYAVSHHHGATMDSGHYVASCKNPRDGNWYKYDDHEVSRTSVPSGSSAYILCYSNIPHNLGLAS